MIPHMYRAIDAFQKDWGKGLKDPTDMYIKLSIHMQHPRVHTSQLIPVKL